MLRTPQAEPSWHGVDPESPNAERWDDPFPSLAWFRARAPVNHTPAQLWRVYRYADCVRVLRELPCGVRRTDGTAPGNAMGGGGSNGAGGQFMLQQDPPTHTRLRKLVAKAFTPRAAEKLRPRAREIVRGLVDEAIEQREFDLIAGLALPLPSQLICEMLGVPSADRARFTRWTGVATHLLRGSYLAGEERARVEATVQELAGYFNALIEERRKHLGDDLISTLIRAEEAGDQLSPTELLIQSIGLLVAGFETTIGLIGLGAKNLIDHPDQQERLRRDPSLTSSAIEECLRFEGPIGMTTRVLHADANLDVRTIPANTTLWLSLWSANRDPAQFPNPDAFDVARTPNPHLAFGAGTHACLGMHLARMEAQEALGALVARTKSLARDAAPLAWGASVFRVPAALRVRAELA
ncbi:MAG: cytochrome P450 [Deltaproteobacteria bacterium]|nr:cytochrome P450 [Deltaproteobacteria bacterium]